ncbi:hypothetical protein O0L34_g4534 [Tuta absoluta]|nr:hypothetical protein O0L34_g4534 [Tuta absoluta]
MPNRLSLKNLEAMPKDFNKDTIRIINRILSDPAILGIVYFKDYNVYMCTVPSDMRRGLTTMLPYLSPLVHRAVMDIDVLDELVAYRISSKTCDILVTGGKDIGAVAVQAKPKKRRKL